MNRIIKFRVWHNIEKCWQEEWKHPRASIQVFRLPKKASLKRYKTYGNKSPYATLSHIFQSPDFHTACQFTGLKDINGKEIYEGDIVKFSYIPIYKYADNDPDQHYPIFTGSFEQNEIGFVGFNLSCFMIYHDKKEMEESPGCGNALLSFYPYDGEINSEKQGQIEIVGNIFENPELLK